MISDYFILFLLFKFPKIQQTSIVYTFVVACVFFSWNIFMFYPSFSGIFSPANWSWWNIPEAQPFLVPGIWEAREGLLWHFSYIFYHTIKVGWANNVHWCYAMVRSLALPHIRWSPVGWPQVGPARQLVAVQHHDLAERKVEPSFVWIHVQLHEAQRDLDVELLLLLLLLMLLMRRKRRRMRMMMRRRRTTTTATTCWSWYWGWGWRRCW